MTARDRDYPVQRMRRAYFEAEFGPIRDHEHESEIMSLREGTPAFLVWPQLCLEDDVSGDVCPPIPLSLADPERRFDDGHPVPLWLRPVDPPPDAA